MCSLKNLGTFRIFTGLQETVYAKVLYHYGPTGFLQNLWTGFFEIMHIAHLITHLVKFLRKSSEIKGDKNFEARRGGRYQIQTFDKNLPQKNPHEWHNNVSILNIDS